MKARHIARFLGAAVVMPWALMSAPVASASAGPCPDAEVVFARGTGEPPGVGETGQAFVDSPRSRVGGKSVGVYAVNYPATTDFPTALDGINDAGAHIQHMAADCPNTKMVLGGYSQGAAVMGFVTANAVPDGAPENSPHPMPPEAARGGQPRRRGRPVRKTIDPVHGLDSASHRSRSARRMRPKPSSCAPLTTRFALTEETGSHMPRTRTTGWSTRGQLSPRVASS